jgi:hypothetical protein
MSEPQFDDVVRADVTVSTNDTDVEVSSNDTDTTLNGMPATLAYWLDSNADQITDSAGNTILVRTT